MTRIARPLLLVAAAFVAAGGFVHLRDWLDIYRHVPASVSGSDVVRIGFPINALASVVIALALVLAATRVPRLTLPTVGAAIAFQVTSLATLILSRTGTVLGWSEPVWTVGADQSRAAEIGALVALTGAAALSAAHQPVRTT